MDGTDSIDSEVVNYILFKSFRIAGPVEELTSNPISQGSFSSCPELTEYQSQLTQSWIEVQHWL